MAIPSFFGGSQKPKLKRPEKRAATPTKADKAKADEFVKIAKSGGVAPQNQYKEPPKADTRTAIQKFHGITEGYQPGTAKGTYTEQKQRTKGTLQNDMVQVDKELGSDSQHRAIIRQALEAAHQLGWAAKDIEAFRKDAVDGVRSGKASQLKAYADQLASQYKSKSEADAAKKAANAEKEAKYRDYANDPTAFRNDAMQEFLRSPAASTFIQNAIPIPGLGAQIAKNEAGYAFQNHGQQMAGDQNNLDTLQRAISMALSEPASGVRAGLSGDTRSAAEMPEGGSQLEQLLNFVLPFGIPGGGGAMGALTRGAVTDVPQFSTGIKDAGGVGNFLDQMTGQGQENPGDPYGFGQTDPRESFARFLQAAGLPLMIGGLAHGAHGLAEGIKGKLGKSNPAQAMPDYFSAKDVIDVHRQKPGTDPNISFAKEKPATAKPAPTAGEKLVRPTKIPTEAPRTPGVPRVQAEKIKAATRSAFGDLVQSEAAAKPKRTRGASRDGSLDRQKAAWKVESKTSPQKVDAQQASFRSRPADISFSDWQGPKLQLDRVGATATVEGKMSSAKNTAQAASVLLKHPEKEFRVNFRAENEKDLAKYTKRVNEYARQAGFTVGAVKERVEAGYKFDGQYVVDLTGPNHKRETLMGAIKKNASPTPSPLVQPKESAKPQAEVKPKLVRPSAKVEVVNKPVWEMTQKERDDAVANLKETHKAVLATPLMSEGGISPTQLSRMSEKQKARWRENGQKRLEIESQIDRLMHPEDAKTRKDAADSRATEGRLSQLNRQKEDLQRMGIGKNGKMKPTYAAALEKVNAELESLAPTPKRTPPASVKPEEQAKVKEPWEMTKVEALESAKKLIADNNALPDKLPNPKKAEVRQVETNTLGFVGKAWRVFLDGNETGGSYRSKKEAEANLKAYETIDNRAKNSNEFYEKTFDLTTRHKAAVQKALSEGKPVPAEVLADYPDLAPKAEKVWTPEPGKRATYKGDQVYAWEQVGSDKTKITHNGRNKIVNTSTLSPFVDSIQSVDKSPHSNDPVLAEWDAYRKRFTMEQRDNVLEPLIKAEAESIAKGRYGMGLGSRWDKSGSEPKYVRGLEPGQVEYGEVYRDARKRVIGKLDNGELPDVAAKLSPKRTKADALTDLKTAFNDISKGPAGAGLGGVNPDAVARLIKHGIEYGAKSAEEFIQHVARAVGDKWDEKYAPTLKAAWDKHHSTGRQGKETAEAPTTRKAQPQAEKSPQEPLKPEPNPPSGEPTGLARQFEDPERIAKGKEPTTPQGTSAKAIADAGERAYKENPHAARTLVDTAHKENRSLSKEETGIVSAYKRALSNEEKSLAAQAQKEGIGSAAHGRMLEIGDQLDKISDVAQNTRGEFHGLGMALQSAFEPDFTFHELARKAKGLYGGELSARLQEKLTKITDAHSSAMDTIEAQKVQIADLMRQLADRAKRGVLVRGANLKRTAASRLSDLGLRYTGDIELKKGGGMKSKQSGAVQIPEFKPDMAKSVADYARGIVYEEGFTNLDDLVSRIQKDFPELSDSNILGSLSGKYREAKANTDVAMAQSRKLMNEVARIAKYRQKTVLGKIADNVIETLNATQRAFQFGVDLSAAAIQGLPSLLAHPVQWVKAWGPSLKSAGKGMREAQRHYAQIIDHPLYAKAKLSGFEVHEPGGSFTAQNEMFAGAISARMAESKIPVIKQIGQVVEHSEAAFTSYLNELAWSTWLKEQAIRPNDPLYLQDISQMVNIATGKGHGRISNALKAAGKLPGFVMTAPRYTLSQFQFASEPMRVAFGAYKTPLGKARALKAYGQAAAGIVLSSMLVEKLGGTVEKDPRSSDYLKWTLPNGVQYDGFSRLAQPVKILAQLLYGRISKAGNFTRVGDYGAMDIWDVMRGKASPAIKTLQMVGTGMRYDSRAGKDVPATGLDLLTENLTPIGARNIARTVLASDASDAEKLSSLGEIFGSSAGKAPEKKASTAPPMGVPTGLNRILGREPEKLTRAKKTTGAPAKLTRPKRLTMPKPLGR